MHGCVARVEPAGRPAPNCTTNPVNVAVDGKLIRAYPQCAGRESCDVDHLQNFVYDALAGIDTDKLAADLLETGKEKIPDYALNCQRRPSLPCGLRWRKLSPSGRLPHVEGEARGQEEGGFLPRGAACVEAVSARPFRQPAGKVSRAD